MIRSVVFNRRITKDIRTVQERDLILIYEARRPQAIPCKDILGHS